MKVISAKKVLIDNDFTPATLVLAGGKIQEIQPYTGEGIDCGDLLVVPGFVDLHSDTIEKEVEPRSGVFFPIEGAIRELDKKLAIVGITHFFHAISFEEDIPGKIRNPKTAEQIVRTIKRLNPELLINHYVLLRYEISAPEAYPIVKSLIEEGYVDLFSIMDHSPGRGQFKTFESWKAFYAQNYNLDDKALEELKNKKLSGDKEGCALKLIQLARKHGIKIASHDDDSPEKIKFNLQQEITISEFPLNLPTAQFAHQHGITIGMGAPNVVRNKSQSGNVPARKLIKHGVCDYLCSDYYPGSLLRAVFSLHQEMNFSLAQSFQFITSNPARAVTIYHSIAKDSPANLAIINPQPSNPEVVATIAKGKFAYLKEGPLAI